ncbi:hypothetical protein ABTZ78_17080 [Streptomyces bauhiniae]|uniref:hypothetical protein n=1 Tax=Streptomyces bauhiniae TaxID=2340725 RepID=UPI003327D8D5
MHIRQDLADLLAAGHSDRAIARQLNVDAQATVAVARHALGLPKAKPGVRPAATAEILFHRRTQAADGGHLRWKGSVTRGGLPSLRHGGRNLSAYRIAYRIAHGREPQGKVLPTCKREGCVQIGHHADRGDRARAQDRAAFVRAWNRGRTKAILAQRARAETDRAREQRLEDLFDAIFGDQR